MFLLSLAIPLTCFVMLAFAVRGRDQPYFDWDLAVTKTIQAWGWHGLDIGMRLISAAGDHMLTAASLVLLACLILAAGGAWRTAFILGIAVTTGQLIKLGVKGWVGRPRPTSEIVHVLTDVREIHSFPSGHTLHYTIFFGFLWFLAFTSGRSVKLRWPLLVMLGGLVLLVGISRIYLGAHWASDVVAGYILGGTLLAFFIHLYQWPSLAQAEPTQNSPNR